MSDHIKTVKGRVVFLLVVFALVITLLALLISFNTVYSFQRRIAVRSAEFNLQLVAGLIEQDLRDLSTLGNLCGNNEQVSQYFLFDDEPNRRIMEAWQKLSDEYISSRSGRYVRRLIVFNDSLTKFLQVGNSTFTSEPVSVYNLRKILETGVEITQTAVWQPIIADPYVFPGVTMVVPFIYPLLNPFDRSEIGTVFLAANTALITDKFRNYSLSASSVLYLTMGTKSYQIENDLVRDVDFPYTVTGRGMRESAGSAALVMEGKDPDGRRNTLVSYPIRDGISLVQVLYPAHYITFSGALPTLAAGFVILIILLIIMAYGVNRMARQINLLMDKRLEDEKNKRDLEYRMLQSQINPHFLYNTLNSIKWMATIQNAAGIAEMTTALSRFLKTLSKETRELVPLRDELLMLEDYLLIQKYRYGGSVNFENRIVGELLDIPIPRFTLQPLAENAIFHGIEPKGSGNIVLSAEREGRDLLVSLTDDGVGMAAISPEAGQPEINQGLGIRSVEERLRYAFGEGYGLSIESP